MNFGKHIGKALATMTYAAATIWFSSLSTAEKEEALGYELTITDKPGQEIWKVGVSALFPIVQLATMSTVKVDVNGTEQVVEDGQTIKLKNNGLFTFAMDSTTKEITHAVKGTSADNGKVLTFGTDGSVSPVALPTMATVAVETGSEDLLTVTNVGSAYKVGMSKLALAGEWYEAAGVTSMADYLATPQFTTDQPELDDKVVVTTSTGIKQIWTAKVKNPSTLADFILVSNFDITQGYIRNSFQGIDGVNVNQTTGDVKAVRDAVAARNNVQISANGILVDVYGAILDGNSLEKTIADHRADINTALNRGYENALTKIVDGTTGAQKVVSGGDYTQATTYDAKAYDVEYNTTGTGVFKVNGLMRFTNAARLFEAVDPVGNVRLVKMNQWGVFDTSEINPNL